MTEIIKQQIDACVNEYEDMVSKVCDGVTYFTLYELLGVRLSAIESRCSDRETFLYIHAKIDSLFGCDSVYLS